VLRDLREAYRPEMKLDGQVSVHRTRDDEGLEGQERRLCCGYERHSRTMGTCRESILWLLRGPPKT